MKQTNKSFTKLTLLNFYLSEIQMGLNAEDKIDYVNVFLKIIRQNVKEEFKA